MGMRPGCTALSPAGRVCVPIDLEKLEDFDPFAVPTIRYGNFNVVMWVTPLLIFMTLSDHDVKMSSFCWHGDFHVPISSLLGCGGLDFILLVRC